jgi:hypothetical protein
MNEDTTAIMDTVTRYPSPAWLTKAPEDVKTGSENSSSSVAEGQVTVNNWMLWKVEERPSNPRPEKYCGMDSPVIGSGECSSPIAQGHVSKDENWVNNLTPGQKTPATLSPFSS